MLNYKFVAVIWAVLYVGTVLAATTFVWHDIRTTLGPWIIMDVDEKTTWVNLLLHIAPIIADQLWIPAFLSIVIVWAFEKYSDRT